MQLEAQTTTRDSIAVSVGALEIEIVIQGALEVLSLYLAFYIVTQLGRRLADMFGDMRENTFISALIINYLVF